MRSRKPLIAVDLERQLKSCPWAMNVGIHDRLRLRDYSPRIRIARDTRMNPIISRLRAGIASTVILFSGLNSLASHPRPWSFECNRLFTSFSVYDFLLVTVAKSPLHALTLPE